MIKNWILYNIIILYFKIIKKKHSEEYNSYKFRSLEDYKYKIEYGKDPYDFFNIYLYEKRKDI